MGSKLTRRQALRSLGGVAAAAIVAPWLAKTISPSQQEAKGAEAPMPRRQWAMVIDLRKCDGHAGDDKPPQCTEACNAEHFVPKDQQWIRVYRVEETGGGSYFMPRPCLNCENAPCLNVCPTHATYRNEEGVVLIDHDRCIGCRLCMAACPYQARSFNWGQPENPPGATFVNYRPEYPVPHRRGTVEKCMLCSHRTEHGRLPACVEACPRYALYLGDLVEDVATNGKEVVKLSRFLVENNAFRLKEELGTRPRVWYIPGHGQEQNRQADDKRQPKEARSWQEQGSNLDPLKREASHEDH